MLKHRACEWLDSEIGVDVSILPALVWKRDAKSIERIFLSVKKFVFSGLFRIFKYDSESRHI